jgi:site-specific DNA recombinase
LYYSCAGCQQKGKTVCNGPAHPGGDLTIGFVDVKQHVLAPDGIADLLKSLMERQAAKSESVDQASHAAAGDK